MLMRIYLLDDIVKTIIAKSIVKEVYYGQNNISCENNMRKSDVKISMEDYLRDDNFALIVKHKDKIRNSY